ncbi:MAG TPA: right-handed parallel beta-helix repeat-containing protein [Chitinophagales bacterium]|nr:right-handed parallel beta-helix repeat-containing protein [Chitinophagales bacterium]
MKITSTTVITRTEYILDANPSPDSSLIVIEGNNIQVDFSNALLHSSGDVTKPDQFHGVAIFIHNSKNITLRNARIRGYKIAVRAENVENLTIENCDFSYNFRKHLNSTQEREDVSDWMSYHHNEHHEWLHYGAGIYLDHCNNAFIRDCKITNGQCALLMTNCNNGKILNNNFSFNSGLGIGMYRSSGNEVMHNHLDWNIRGFSFGIYNRGQDSAGILVYEQSSKNLFAYNTATHSGDGFFLWAGQATMDTGSGGCNDNVIFGNDFSDASNNGIEATFSRNAIINNRIERCDYGVWGGYSYNTIIGSNQFANNRCAIAIEHGQNNHILYNSFDHDQLAIKLWSNKEQPGDWGYVKTHDTRSHGYSIMNNLFSGVERGYEFTRTDSIEINREAWNDTKIIYKPDMKSTMINFGKDARVKQEDIDRFIRAFAPEEKSSIPDSSAHQGRENILVTGWGPYDFQRPILWLDHTDSSGKMFFKILGPFGKWRMQRMQGVKLSRLNGIVPDTISAVPIPGTYTDISVDMQYVGDYVIDEFGSPTDARQPFDFSYHKFYLPMKWIINYYKMDTFNPAKYSGVFSNAVRKKGLVETDSAKKLEFTWWGTPDKNVPEDHFAVIATATQNFPKGVYALGITADDGVRLYVDDKLVMDAWDNSKNTFDDESHHEVIMHLEGQHKLKVEYYDYTGFATLMVSIRKQE